MVISPFALRNCAIFNVTLQQGEFQTTIASTFPKTRPQNGQCEGKPYGVSLENFFSLCVCVCVCVNSVRCTCVHILKSYVCMHAHMCSTACVQCMLIHVRFDVHSVMTEHMAVAWLWFPSVYMLSL